MAWETTHLDPERLADALHCAQKAAVGVSEKLKDHFGKTDYKTKAHAHDYVTKWDAWAEEEIIKALSAFSSEIGILAEEGGGRPGRELYWTVDPIDGTFHFVQGTPKCTTMVSLVDNGLPVLGVIYDFVHDDMYTAALGQGAFKNTGQRLVMRPPEEGEATIEFFTNLPEGESLQSAINDAGIQTVHNAASGFAATGAVNGRNNGVCFIGTEAPNEWDIAPLVALIHEAGGEVTNLIDKEYKIGQRSVLAAHPDVTAKIRGALKQADLSG
jgi:myo-inositol-1(or 4)-monophosphatase